MSLIHMVAAINADGLSMTEKLVMIIMAEYVNADTGECWPSQASVARKAGVTRETVGRVCRALQDRGLILIESRRRENGSATTNRIIFLPPKLEAAQPVLEDKPCDPGSHGEAVSHVSDDHTPCDPGSHPHVILAHTQNLPDITSHRTETRAREVEVWREFHERVIEAAGEDVVDLTSTAMHGSYPLRMLLEERPGIPACSIDDVIEGVRKAAAVFRKRGGKMSSWGLAVRIACEFRDQRLAGVPVKAVQGETIGDLSAISGDTWRGFVLMSNANGGKWEARWGPPPGADGSFVPAELVELWKGRVTA